MTDIKKRWLLKQIKQLETDNSQHSSGFDETISKLKDILNTEREICSFDTGMAIAQDFFIERSLSKRKNILSEILLASLKPLTKKCEEKIKEEGYYKITLSITKIKLKTS